MPVQAPEKVANHLFRIVWQILASLHLCDEYLGAEFERVKRHWFNLGCPTPLGAFIIKHANTSPEVKS